MMLMVNNIMFTNMNDHDACIVVIHVKFQAAGIKNYLKKY